MTYSFRVHGRLHTHDVTMWLSEDGYTVHLKCQTGEALREWKMDPKDCISPPKGSKSEQYGPSWMLQWDKDTMNPDRVGSFSNEKAIVVVGILAYRRRECGEWDPWVDSVPARREFLKKLRELQSCAYSKYKTEQINRALDATQLREAK